MRTEQRYLDKYAAAKQAGQDFDKDIDELVQRLKDAERDMPGIMDTIIAYNGPMKETTNENVRIEESLIESKTEKQIDVFRNKTERKSNHIESPDQQPKGIPENEESADTEPNPDLT